ncbi:hypothetical protein P167DRAFT_540808 [Morchella conica CCBAS932]|uniref:Uncharacterized protein n=1 Tax=Morchella conica CCBAS932 TaxID=1392247 RepID=A0A3N4KKT9_9PEZI|nr:hypothetical protein P167DRAFT_540808 [Morchella conica CCBAS932]
MPYSTLVSIIKQGYNNLFGNSPVFCVIKLFFLTVTAIIARAIIFFIIIFIRIVRIIIVGIVSNRFSKNTSLSAWGSSSSSVFFGSACYISSHSNQYPSIETWTSSQLQLAVLSCCIVEKASFVQVSK